MPCTDYILDVLYVYVKFYHGNNTDIFVLRNQCKTIWNNKRL